MAPKWIAFILFIWIAGSMLGLVIEGSQVGASEESAVQKILGWREVVDTGGWGLVQLVALPLTFFQGLFQLLTFQFSFLDNTPGSYISLLVLAPIVGVVIFGAVIVFIGIFRSILN